MNYSSTQWKQNSTLSLLKFDIFQLFWRWDGIKTIDWHLLGYCKIYISFFLWFPPKSYDKQLLPFINLFTSSFLCYSILMIFRSNLIRFPPTLIKQLHSSPLFPLSLPPNTSMTTRRRSSAASASEREESPVSQRTTRAKKRTHSDDEGDLPEKKWVQILNPCKLIFIKIHLLSTHHSPRPNISFLFILFL